MAGYREGEKYSISRLWFFVLVFIVFLIFFFVSLANTLVLISLEISGSTQGRDILFIANIILTILALVLLAWSGYELFKYIEGYGKDEEEYVEVEE